MPAPTNSERILQLEKLTNDLNSASQKIESDAKAMSDRIERLREAERSSSIEIAVLKEKIAALEKSSDNSSRIKWAIGTALISVSMGVLLNYLLRLTR